MRADRGALCAATWPQEHTAAFLGRRIRELDLVISEQIWLLVKTVRP